MANRPDPKTRLAIIRFSGWNWAAEVADSVLIIVALAKHETPKIPNGVMSLASLLGVWPLAAQAPSGAAALSGTVQDVGEAAVAGAYQLDRAGVSTCQVDDLEIEVG